MIKKIIFINILISISFLSVYSQQSDSTKSLIKISGYIKDANLKPLYGANIVLEGTIDGATADSAGYYEFQTNKFGNKTLIITAIDYKEKFYNINIEAGKNISQNIVLSKEEVKTDEILVTASSFTAGQNSQVTLTPFEIVRIPGSDADLYRALTTFPGSNQVDEGSRLTVRGGDPSEVLTILDQASLYNPFIFDEDYNTTSFSTVNPWGLKGINFTSGGFSSKFGNSLSAVLDLQSYDMPQNTGLFAWLGLAGASLSGEYISRNKKFGASFLGNTTYLEPYFKINGKLGADYNPLPYADGVGGTLSYKFGNGKYLKFYSDFARDKIGIKSVTPSYDGYFNSRSETYFSNLKYSTPLFIGSSLNVGFSYSYHLKDIGLGILNTNERDIYSKLRIDLSTPVKKKIVLSYGSEYEFTQNNFNGTVPVFAYNLRPDAFSYNISSKEHSGRIGGYFESQFRFTKKFFTIAGIRSDYHTLSKKFNFDPRLSLGYQFVKDNVLRAAVGIYHQYPDLQYYAQSINNNLKPEEAIHYILGYEINKMDGLFMFRVEAYYKDYKNLVKLDSTNVFNYNYLSNGSGRAKGIDVFLKSKVTNKYSAWISYSYTDSKRNQLDYNAMTSADYDITHSLSVVATYNITDNISIGSTYKISTGKPFTPVIGSVFDSTQNAFIPFYSIRNSSRFPAYQRWDADIQFLFSFFGRFAVAVVQVTNIINQKNLYGYTYNTDYSQRIPIYSTNGRQLYVGFGVGF